MRLGTARVREARHIASIPAYRLPVALLQSVVRCAHGARSKANPLGEISGKCRGNTMKPHQQRVVEEKEELDEKRQRLGEFKNTDLFAYV